MSSMQCPVTHDFEPFSASYLADPYPLYNRLREDSPVSYVPSLNLYLVTRYEDAVRILRDRDTFSAANSTIPFMPIAPEAAAILASGFPRKPTFSNCDPPRHPKMRHAASLCLSSRRWAATQPLLRAYVDKLIDRLLDKPVADLGADLAFALTTLAGFSLLGFPAEDTERLRGWCGKRVMLTYGDLSVEDQVEAAHNLVDFWSYCRDFVKLRQENPADDLTSDLLRLVEKGVDGLDVEDVTNMVYSISLASHETTAGAILNGMKRLLTQREAWDALCADPNLIPNTVEELLRLDGPVVTHRRLTTADTQISDVPIPAGSMVMMLLGAANHDPRHFEQPERFDPHRANASDHLTFGKFWHLCLGAPLARFEYGLVLERLTARAPRMRLVEDQRTQYAPIILLRTPDKLLVEPQPARQAAGSQVAAQ